MGAAAGAVLPAPNRNIDRLFQFCVLGMVATGYFAVAGSGYLDVPTIALTAGALIVRVLITIRLLNLRFAPALVNAATLAYIGFYPVDYLFVSHEFLPATVHLVFFLAITKVLTAVTERDFSYLKVVAFLELMAACMLNSRLNFFLFLALFLLFAVGTFSSTEIRRAAGRQDVRVVRAGYRGLSPRLIGLGLLLSFGVLSLTGGLFFFLPRTARAAFRHLVPERYHLPGFSNEVTLGQLGEIKNQSTPVLHVRFLSPTWPPNLKWRGAALGRFDGKRWSNDSQLRYEQIRIEHGGLVRLIEDPLRPPSTARRIWYEVHQKDFGADTLFFAGIPEFLRISAPVIRRSQSNSVRIPLSANGTIEYIAHAYIEPAGNEAAPPIAPLTSQLRSEYLDLPALDPRIPRLAAEWSGGLKSPVEQARAIERHLRQDYGYTLTLLNREVPDPLADFLFERRKGHCEYFASAMAVMLRTMDIPSRVVTGFQSGVFNPISGLQVIRTSDAHSWVEAWLPGRGWTTFDPTPPDPSAGAESAWSRIGLYLDAADTFWQDWVLNYDLDHQLLLATRVQEGGRGPSWTDRVAASVNRWKVAAAGYVKRYGAPVAAALITLGFVLFYGPALWKRWLTRQRIRRVQSGRAEVADATLLYSRMLKCLERRGFEKPAWLTAGEFARGLPPSDIAPIVEDLTECYQRLRYGGQRDAAPRMLALLERLERS